MRSTGSSSSDMPGLIGLGVVLIAPVCVVWLAGALAGLLATGRPLQIGLAGAARVLTRLPSHLARPGLAWPANLRGQLPGPLALQISLAVSAVLILALLAAALILFAWVNRRGAHGRAASFASRSELAELRVRRPQSGRVTLGVHHRALIAAEKRASVVVVGPSQAGKTRGLVVPALLEWDGSGCCPRRSRATSSTTPTSRAPSVARSGSSTRQDRAACRVRRGRRSWPPAPGRAPAAPRHGCSVSASPAWRAQPMRASGARRDRGSSHHCCSPPRTAT